MIRELIYISQSTSKAINKDIIDILSVARTRNETLNITGVLMCDGINFLQLIEGSDTSVDALIHSLLKDPRHTNMSIVLDQRIETRSYQSWRMGFRFVDSIDHKNWINWKNIKSEIAADIKTENSGPKILRLLFSQHLKAS